MLRPGYRCLNNGRDDEAAVPRLCIVCPEQSRVLRHLTVQRSEKGPKLAGQPYDRSRLCTESASCPPSSVVARDYLRSELDVLSTTVSPSLAGESTTANGSACMTGVGWNLAEQGHSQPMQVNSTTLDRDPVTSTQLYVSGLLRVGLLCSNPSSPGAQPLWRVGNGWMGSLGSHCGCRQHCESRQISSLT